MLSVSYEESSQKRNKKNWNNSNFLEYQTFLKMDHIETFLILEYFLWEYLGIFTLKMGTLSFLFFIFYESLRVIYHSDIFEELNRPPWVSKVPKLILGLFLPPLPQTHTKGP